MPLCIHTLKPSPFLLLFFCLMHENHKRGSHKNTAIAVSDLAPHHLHHTVVTTLFLLKWYVGGIAGEAWQCCGPPLPAVNFTSSPWGVSGLLIFAIWLSSSGQRGETWLLRSLLSIQGKTFFSTPFGSCSKATCSNSSLAYWTWMKECHYFSC